MRKNEKLHELLQPAITALGYELVGVEYHPNSVNALVRVYIDKEGGIQMDDCVAANQQISGVFDVEDPIPGKYTLEVSSPGLDRPLFSLADFERFINQSVKIRLSRPIAKQRNFKGKISSVNDNVITLTDPSGQECLLDFNYIDVARLIPTFD